MKQIFIGFLSLILLGLIAVAVAAGWSVLNYQADGPLQESKLVLIDRGSGVNAIAAKLEKEGVIKHGFLFKAFGRLPENLKAGEYEFPAKISMTNVIAQIEEGEVFDRKITIIEGLTSYQIVRRLNARDDLGGEKITTIPAEGSLLPDTYQFVTGETKAQKIAQMQTAMQKTLDKLWEQRDQSIPIKSKKEALILASIVEKETSVANERKKVAGVFVNRLRKGMKLQTDPTVIYALTKGKIQEEGKGPLGRRLLRKDLKVNSPYNTYQNTGLPPGPIANPGRDAIEAVLNPESHDYIFFVADGTGGHAFGRTLKEHNANVAKWRKIRSKN